MKTDEKDGVSQPVKLSVAVNKPNLGSLRTRGSLSGLAAEASKDQVIMLHPDEIETPKQVRKVFVNIRELRMTIDSDGQQTPIEVGPKKANGKYELLKGGRRYRAACLEPVIMLRALVNTTDYSSAKHKAVMSQVIENGQREGLLPHEEGQAYYRARQLALEHGEKITNREIAEYVGKTEAQISTLIAIADIPDSLVNLIETGVTRDADMLNSMRILHGLNIDLYDQVVAKATENGALERAAVRDAVKMAKAQQSGGSAAPATEPRATGAAATQELLSSATDESAKPGTQPSLLKNDTSAASNAGLTSTAVVATIAETANEKFAHAQTINESSGSASEVLEQAAKLSEQAEKGAPKKTVHVTPDQLLIFVRVSFDADVQHGYLLTDRVCPDANKAWVSVVGSGGQSANKLVATDDIQIVSISSRS